MGAGQVRCVVKTGSQRSCFLMRLVPNEVGLVFFRGLQICFPCVVLLSL